MRKSIINAFVALALSSPCYGMEPDEDVKLALKRTSPEHKMNENDILEEFVQLLTHSSEDTFEQSMGTSFLKYISKFDAITPYTLALERVEGDVEAQERVYIRCTAFQTISFNFTSENLSHRPLDPHGYRLKGKYVESAKSLVQRLQKQFPPLIERRTLIEAQDQKKTEHEDLRKQSFAGAMKKLAFPVGLLSKDYKNPEDFYNDVTEATGFGLCSENICSLPAFNPSGSLVDDEDQVSTVNGFGSIVNDDFSALINTFGKESGPFVLDIGCGIGNNSQKPINTGSTVILNDLSLEQLGVAATNFLGKGKFFINNKRFPDQMNFPDNSLSSILLSYVGHYFSPRELIEGFQKMRSWLMPGGRIYYRVLGIDSNPFNFFRNAYDQKKKDGEVWPGYIPDVKTIKPDGIRGLPNMVHPHGALEFLHLANETDFNLLDVCEVNHNNDTPPGTVEGIFEKPFI